MKNITQLGILLFALVFQTQHICAQDFDTFIEDDDAKSLSSPQSYALEFKLGPYAPNIDSEFSGGQTPFKDLFGSGTDIMYNVELDFQLLNIFGSLGLGLGLGYYQNSAHPFKDNGSDSSSSTLSDRLAGDTSILLVPLSILAVYRFDVLANHFNFPFVPYAKMGFNYTLWWIDRPDGETASFQGDEAKGGTLSWQFNLGLALRLDILEPSAAKSLDVNSGVNHSYIFFEMTHLQKMSGDTALDITDTSWLAGLAIEF